MHFEMTGDGPPLVLLHGIGSSSRSWRCQTAALRSAFTVVAWDAPGFGESPDLGTSRPCMADYAHALAALLDRLHLDAVRLVGHSFGGIVAQELCRHYLPRVVRLVLADTTRGGGAEPPELRQRKLDERLRMMDTMAPDEIARARAPRLLSRQADAGLVRDAVDLMSEIRPDGYRAAAIAMSEADERDVLPAIDIPTLLIWGGEDTITPLDEGRAMQKALPSARLEVIPGAGHLSYLERPEVFSRLLREFFSSELNS